MSGVRLLYSVRPMPPVLDRDAMATSLQPLGPLCALGVGDPVAIRQILRKCGITAIVVTPDGNGWRFEGQADFRVLYTQGLMRGPPYPPTLGRAPAEPWRASIAHHASEAAMLSKEDDDLITKTGLGRRSDASGDGHAGAPFNACLSTRSLSPVPGGAGSRSPEIARHAHFLSLTSS